METQPTLMSYNQELVRQAIVRYLFRLGSYSKRLPREAITTPDRIDQMIGDSIPQSVVVTQERIMQERYFQGTIALLAYMGLKNPRKSKNPLRRVLHWFIIPSLNRTLNLNLTRLYRGVQDYDIYDSAVSISVLKQIRDKGVSLDSFISEQIDRIPGATTSV